MATWTGNVAEIKYWEQLLYPLLNSISWPLNKIMPVCTLPGYLSSLATDVLPIEHLWNVLDRGVCHQVPVPQNDCQLQVAVLEECDNTSNLPGHKWHPGDGHALQVYYLCMRQIENKCYWSLWTPGLLFWNWCECLQIKTTSDVVLENFDIYSILSQKHRFFFVLFCL